MRFSLAPVAPWTLQYLDADPTGPAGPARPARPARPLWTLAQCFLAHVMPRGTGPSRNGPVRFPARAAKAPGPRRLSVVSLACLVTIAWQPTAWCVSLQAAREAWRRIT